MLFFPNTNTNTKNINLETKREWEVLLFRSI